MERATRIVGLDVVTALACFLGGRSPGAEVVPADELSAWTIHIANDNCPDYTWGWDEAATRQAFADIVRAHLDEMARTDGYRTEHRDRYNMAVAQEALCFLERYPDRREELFRRVREGRIFVSPFLCNSLWAFQGVEGAIRTLYPARRLEKEIGVRLDVAEHIELPSLPWGMATVLGGCGIRWASIPFLSYDTTFRELACPPLFILEGPDGTRLRVVLDAWASLEANYTQGAAILKDSYLGSVEWCMHYRDLGSQYPLREALASGTHGDISPSSGGQAREFAEAIRKHGEGPQPRPLLVNSTLPRFTAAVDAAEARAPFLRTIGGTFGHSWDLWPVSLAAYAARMRDGERRLLAAESLIAAGTARDPEIAARTRESRERAEWCLAMLSDHAWNGASDENRIVNAKLRREWSEELLHRAAELTEAGWKAVGIQDEELRITIFNPLSFPRREPIEVDLPQGARPAWPQGLAAQVLDDGRGRRLCFLPPEVPGFGIREIALVPAPEDAPAGSAEVPFRIGERSLEGPFWTLRWDEAAGGIRGAVHRPTGRDIVVPGARDALCGTRYHDGREHVLERVTCRVVDVGPVLARLRMQGEVAGIRVRTFATVYAAIDRLDLEADIEKPVDTSENRLTQAFPVAPEGAAIRIEETGAVVRLGRAPAGDLLPGADPRRFAVQGFVDATVPGGPGVTVVPLDAFVVRADLGKVVFEPVGNDQNHRECSKDQDGVTSFRFRYAVVAHAGDWSGPEAFAASRSASFPLLARPGRLAVEAPGGAIPAFQAPALDPARAIATCWKPADSSAPEGTVLRVQETAGRGEPLEIRVPGARRAVRTDLLERDLEELPIADGAVRLPLPGRGLAGLRLVR